MRFKDKLPEFCEEVRGLLTRMNRHDLAAQLPGLDIDFICPCTNWGCASFRVTGGSSTDAFEMPGARHSTYAPSIRLDAETGSVSVMVDQLGRITAFEVLKRPDVRRKLLGR